MKDARTDMTCPRCKGALWVCEDHPQAAWSEGCGIEQCGGTGVACVCNPDGKMPPGFQLWVRRDDATGV